MKATENDWGVAGRSFHHTPKVFEADRTRCVPAESIGLVCRNPRHPRDRRSDPRSRRSLRHSWRPEHGHARRKSSIRSFSHCACVAAKPCGAPLRTSSRLPGISACECLPEISNGTMRSLSPWATSVGTVNFFRSARKSVVPKATMHCCVPTGDAAQAIHLLNGMQVRAHSLARLVVVEVGKELLEEVDAVLLHTREHAVEDRLVHAARVVGVFSRNGVTAPSSIVFGTRARAVAPDVARHFAAAHREADEHRVAQVELRHQIVQVRREGVVVVAAGGLVPSRRTRAGRRRCSGIRRR